MTDLQFEKERNKVIDEELLINQKQLTNAISCLYKSLEVLTKLTEGMRHIAYNHPTMHAHREIMQNLRLAEDYEVELGNILSQGNFGRDEIEAELGKKENKKPNFLYLKHDMVDAIAYAIYYTANPDSEMCVPNCAYEKAERMFAEWRDGTREKKAVEMYRTCKTCKYKEMKGSMKCDICSHSLTAIEYEEEKMKMNEGFKKELTSLLNRYSWDNACETPDHIIADYVERCLTNLCGTINQDIAWHSSWTRFGEDINTFHIEAEKKEEEPADK